MILSVQMMRMIVLWIVLIKNISQILVYASHLVLVVVDHILSVQLSLYYGFPFHTVYEYNYIQHRMMQSVKFDVLSHVNILLLMPSTQIHY